MDICRPCCFRISFYGIDNYQKLQTFSASWKMTMNCSSPLTRNVPESSVEHQKISAPQFKTTSPSNLRLHRPLHRPRPSDHEIFIQEDKIEFGQFVVREALGDEELWAVARLRAQTCWDGRVRDRSILSPGLSSFITKETNELKSAKLEESLKKKLAEEIFESLKRQSQQLCSEFCIVTVKKEDSKERNVTDNVLKSVVGTLDLSIEYLSRRQTFPGEKVKPPVYNDLVETEQIKYGNIDGLCVAKSARRRGIATNMLVFAINLAKSNGAKRVYLEVYKSNKPALELYRKMGFEVVERATGQLAKMGTCLLCLEW